MRLSDSVCGSISNIDVYDVRFPTSLEKHGSDAIHGDPDYSAVVVIIKTDKGDEGHGMTFTLGRGNEIVKKAAESFVPFCIGHKLREIFENFGKFWKSLTCEEQIRWIGPEKGAVQMAVGGIINSLWDLWARLEQKPVWRLLVDLNPDEIISLCDFGWLTDEITKEEAKNILTELEATKQERINDIHKNGFPGNDSLLLTIS